MQANKQTSCRVQKMQFNRLLSLLNCVTNIELEASVFCFFLTQFELFHRIWLLLELMQFWVEIPPGNHSDVQMPFYDVQQNLLWQVVLNLTNSSPYLGSNFVYLVLFGWLICLWSSLDPIKLCFEQLYFFHQLSLAINLLFSPDLRIEVQTVI